MMGKLVIARHHESEWNKLGLWTGERDRHLTPYGFEKAEEMGKAIADVLIDYAYASMLVRSIETLSCMLNAKGQYKVPTEFTADFNERDYGDYTGKNKWEMKKLVGEETWNKIRREWDYPVPNGETLKSVYARTIPFFVTRIVPELKRGDTVLIVAHGNSCRALRKYIEGISDKDIKNIEMGFGEIIIYDFDGEGHVTGKEVRQVASAVNA